jgi:hypothetical protein
MPRLRITVPAVVAPLLAIAIGCGTKPADPKAPTLSARFVYVTDKAGITFRHESGATGRKLLPETMGGGVVVLDYNVDGKSDVFFVNSRSWSGDARAAQPALYRNDGVGKFADVTGEAGLDQPVYGMGGCAADFDNDGFPDLFVTAVGGNRLYRNVGGKKFEDVTERAGLKADSWPTAADPFENWNRSVSFPSSATWLDYDGDAKLDLFVCNYVAWSPATDLGINAVLPGGKRAYVPPTQFPGTHCQLFRNLGDGRFREVTFEAGVEVSEPTGMNGTRQPVGKALGVVACDPDEDGWPDLLVANDTVRNFLFHNVPDGNGGRKFEEVGLIANAAYVDGRPRGGMGVDATNLPDGRFAAVVANFSNEPNTLLTLVRKSPMLFADTAAATELTAPSRGPMKFGAFFFDYDLDGRSDLLTANGHLEPDIGLARPGQQQAESAQLYRNTGERFVPVNDPGDLAKPMVGRGSAYLDFDGDGDPDVVVVANGGPAKLFRNDAAGGNKWVRLKLVGDGKRSNRDAIGATVEATVGGEVRRFFVTGSRGYLSQSELVVTVGLGDKAKADQVTVKWPGRDVGMQTWSNLEAGKEHRLEQK